MNTNILPAPRAALLGEITLWPAEWRAWRRQFFPGCRVPRQGRPVRLDNTLLASYYGGRYFVRSVR